MNDEAYPLQWLWAEIARRFGPDQAAELRNGFEAYRRSAFEGERLAELQRQLPELEARLQELEQAGEPETAYIRSLRWRIDHYRRILQEESRLYAS